MLRFHNFSLQFLKDVSHESCVSQPQLALFEGVLAQKLRFHNFDLQFLKEVAHESFAFTTSTCARISRLRDSGCTKSFVLQNQKHASEDGGWVRFAEQRFQRISWVPCGYPCILLSALLAICNFEGSLARCRLHVSSYRVSLSRSKDQCEFLWYPCNPACRARRVRVNFQGTRATLHLMRAILWKR